MMYRGKFFPIDPHIFGPQLRWEDVYDLRRYDKLSEKEKEIVRKEDPDNFIRCAIRREFHRKIRLTQFKKIELVSYWLTLTRNIKSFIKQEGDKFLADDQKMRETYDFFLIRKKEAIDDDTKIKGMNADILQKLIFQEVDRLNKLQESKKPRMKRRLANG